MHRENQALAIVVNMNTPEDKEAATKLQCVLDRCMYPKTCRWNEHCMEKAMRTSKEAKMEREKAIRHETEKDAET